MTRLSVTGAEHVAVRNYLFERPGVYANKPGPLRDSRLAFSPNRVSRYRFCGSPGYSRSQTRRNYVGDRPNPDRNRFHETAGATHSDAWSDAWRSTRIAQRRRSIRAVTKNLAYQSRRSH